MEDVTKAKISAVTIFLTCGTIATISFKLMNNVEVEEGGITRLFFHPYMQTFSMFLGQSIWLAVYLSNRRTHQLALEPGKTPHNAWTFLIPAIADAFSTSLQYMALNFISGSSFLMFKGASIVTTAVFSKLLFGMTVELRHWIGCGSAIVGLIFVGGSGYVEKAAGQGAFVKFMFIQSNATLGYTLMLISLVFNGFHYAYQQFLMRKHTINPLEMIGWEGLFGTTIIGIVATILTFTPCPFAPKMCVLNSQGKPHFERVDVFFGELFTNWKIAVFMVLGFVCLSLYNLNGVRITKLIDALTRSLLNISKTGTVWIIGILLTLTLGDNKMFQIQSTNLLVNLVKIIGFAFIVFGTLVYNRLICGRYFSPSAGLAEPNKHTNLQEEKQVEMEGRQPVSVDSD